MRRRLAVSLVGAALAIGVGVGPAAAFSSGGSVTTGGVTYKTNATSCNLYVSSCSWNTSIGISTPKSFTHRSDVKVNGINVSLTISADPGATITGNSTVLATAKESGYGKSNATAGVAKPSIFSVSVAARSRLTSGSVTNNSGWTTW